MDLREFNEVRTAINKYFQFVKTKMMALQQDKKRNHALQTSIAQFQAMRNANAAQQHRAPPTPPQPQPQQPQPSNATLNEHNLQKHSEQMALQRTLSLSHRQKQASRMAPMSPDGKPPIMISPRIGPDDLKLPPKRKRKDALDSATTPANKSPKIGQASSPASKVASPIVKNIQPEQPRNFKCDQRDCGGAFVTNNELIEHQRWHETERQRQQEEEKRAKWRIENPLDYTLSAVSGALGLNKDGSVKASPGLTTTKAEFSPQSNTPRTVPSPAQKPTATTARPTSGLKGAEQMPTPPTTLWDTALSPAKINQCFEGLEPPNLTNLDNTIFTPEYTPGDSTEADESQAALNTYDEWNPFGMKDVCGPQPLQEIPWENEFSGPKTWDSTQNFGEMAGFMLYVN